MRRSARWALRLAAVAGVLLGAAYMIFFITVGSGVIRDGVRKFGDASALSARGRTAVGTVISKQTLRGAPGGNVQKMTVRFTAADGNEHEMWANGDDRVGTRIRVLYDSADPDVAVTESPTTRRIYAGVFVLLGVVMIIGPPGLVLKIFLEIVLNRRRHRRTAPAA